MNELDRLARGVILVGFDGTALDDRTAECLREAQFAGYVLFARNTGPLAGVRALTDRLRSLHEVPPVIAIDQEGGRVARLRDDVETIPSMMALGAAGSEALARRAGEQIGFDLRRAGCTVDFGPVADLARDASGTAIGTRAFGSDVATVVSLARAVAAGVERYGITATFKHFPGHGTTAEDSHAGLPVTDLDEAALRRHDLAVFSQLVPGASAVMTAHIVVRALDPGQPATLSSRVLRDVLRGELSFRGVCFTDCMQMDAVARSIGTAPGVAAAIAAGADCALVSHDAALGAEAARAIVRAVECGAMSLERLAEAHARVSRLRESSLAPLSLDEPAPHRGIGREIAGRGATLVRGTPRADATACIVLSFENATTEGAAGFHDKHARLEAQAPALVSHTVPLAPNERECREALSALVNSGRRPVVLLRRAHLYAEQARLVASVVERFPDSVVVSMREPYDCNVVPAARHVLAMYGDDDATLGALADVLFGNVSPLGTLPVTT